MLETKFKTKKMFVFFSFLLKVICFQTLGYLFFYFMIYYKLFVE